MTDHLLRRRTPGEQRAYRQGFEAGRAWKHDSDPFAVPVGGGEPQPTTSTDNDDEDEPHYEPPCCCGHVWDEHDIRSSACEVPDCDCCYFDADESVRSAGGGDQPDTPCPHGAPGGWDCCRADQEAPTDKENPHGH